MFVNLFFSDLIDRDKSNGESAFHRCGRQLK